MCNLFRLTGLKHVQVALFACMIAFIPWAARSGTWSVGDYAALTNAIACSINGDTITFSKNITVSNAVLISGKGLTIEGSGFSISVPVPGLDESGVINANASEFRVFTIDASNQTNTIQNLTIMGGDMWGGGIANRPNSTLLLEDVTVTQSGGSGQGGGGIDNNAGTLYMQGCNISRNAAEYGGGFLNVGSSARLFIENCTFSENRSLSSSGGGGAGENQQFLYVNNSTFANNKSTEFGGAINHLNGNAFIVDCTFVGNLAYGKCQGGAIANRGAGASLKLVNSLFAYNYRTNGAPYILDDIFCESSKATGSAYYCTFQSTMDQLTCSVSNRLYTGATNGSDDSIFAGGISTKPLGPDGKEIGAYTIYQPYLTKVGASRTPTAVLKPSSFATGKGARAAFSSTTDTPVVGYYSNNTQWVNLSGTDSSNYEVFVDQNGTNRGSSLTVGAVVEIASNLFMFKVVATNGGTVSGATVYGDVYSSGTVVTVTAIPAVSNRFVRWDYVLGGSGTASTDNPYLITVSTNITLAPVFTNFAGFTISYSGNGYTGGTVPTEQVVNAGDSANISSPGTMVKEGYAFTNWNTRSDGNGTDYAPGADYSGPDNLMLYAKWAQIPQMAVLGTNGTVIASGEAASLGKGTDFGEAALGDVLTNTFSITNSGTATLTISSVTTNGTGASSFSISDLQFSIEAGSASNITIRFAPESAGAFTAAVSIANNSPTTPYVICLRGVGSTSPTDGWLAINVTPETGSWALTAPAGYTGPTSGTGSLAAVNATTGSYSITWGALSGYVAPSNQNLFVTSSSTTIFTGVYTEIPAGNGWLAINVTPETGSWALTAPAGYTGPTSGTGSLAAVNTTTGSYSITWGALSGYVAPSNQYGFVAGGSTTIFSSVYLQISTNINTPSGINATEGTYTNKIRVFWNGVNGASGYEIWRAITNDANTAGRIADIPLIALQRISGDMKGKARHQTEPQNDGRLTGGGSPYLQGTSGTDYYYDDYAINPISAYYYWVRAKTAALISPMSYVGMGYASLSPEQYTGTADIAVSDMVFLPVNILNDAAAGTVSLRLANLGPEALNAAGVAFDFHMGNDASALVWIGSAQSNMTLGAGDEKLIILNPSAKHGLTVRGDLSGIQQVKVVARHMTALNDPNLTNNTTTAAGSVRIKTGGVNSIGRGLNDYDGDGKADGPIYRNADGRWIATLSGYRYQLWLVAEAGLAGLTPVPGDYDGDGITDMATYNRLNGWWTALLSSTEQTMNRHLGGTEYTAAPCDFDGDAITDPVIFRDADGLWAGLMSSMNYAYAESGACGSGYQPLPEDYDGDGKADAAMFNPTSGMWAIGYSGWGYWLLTGPFGGTGWQATPADYDGDGLTDPAIYNSSAAAWQILMSGSLSTEGKYTWQSGIRGSAGGMPVPADYDGDGKADIAVYHQNTGIWQIFLSTLSYREASGGFGGPEYQPTKE